MAKRSPRGYGKTSSSNKTRSRDRKGNGKFGEEKTERRLTEPMRLNRFLARSGVASRRKADEIIAEGRVSVNGEVTTEMGVQVGPGDDIKLDGTPLTLGKQTYILLNKPHDTITTKSDEHDRSTVMDLIDLPKSIKDTLFPVGRLDRHTLGVLLLTSDGELGHLLMHPSKSVEKVYRIETEADVTDEQLQQLVDGIELEDGPAHADQVAYLGDKRVIGLSLHEGRNRQVRRMMEAVGHRVSKLERVQYAGITSKGVRRGKWRHLSPNEVSRLKKQVA